MAPQIPRFTLDEDEAYDRMIQRRLDDMKFCKDCKYINALPAHKDSYCLHEKSIRCGSEYEVTGKDPRGDAYYQCIPMRSGICRDGQLFESRDETQA